MNFEASLKIPTTISKELYFSLLPDSASDKDKKIELKATKKFIILKIKTKKLSHLKGIINTYLSLIKMLMEIDKNEK